MSPDIEQYLRITAKQAEASLVGAETRIAKDEIAGVVSLNLFMAFANYIEYGVIEWHRDRSPVGAFTRALTVAGQAADLSGRACAEIDAGNRDNARRGAPAMPPAKPWMFFDFPSATMISMLLHPEPDPRLLELLPRPSDWNSEAEDNWCKFADSAVLGALTGRSLPGDWEEVLSFAGEDERLSLAGRTYRAYLAVVSALKERDVDQVADALAVSGSLYRERANDDYFSGGIAYDGGDGGERSVDFRVAVILKYGGSGYGATLAGSVSHQWRW